MTADGVEEGSDLDRSECCLLDDARQIARHNPRGYKASWPIEEDLWTVSGSVVVLDGTLGGYGFLWGLWCARAANKVASHEFGRWDCQNGKNMGKRTGGHTTPKHTVQHGGRSMYSTMAMAIGSVLHKVGFG